MQIIRNILFFFLQFCIMLFFASQSFSQDKRFVVVKTGYGLPFGALGGNVEYRWKNIGSYVGAGYMKSQNYHDINIKSTFNSCIGFKYYFYKPVDGLRPVLGMHAGWLNNYYINKIGLANYKNNVYGLALITGVQFSENITSLEIDMLIDPGFAVLQPETHPYYFQKLHLTPSIGLGVNLYALRKYFKYKKRNKQLSYSDSIAISLNNSTNYNLISNKFITPVQQKIETDCNDTMGYKAIKKTFKDLQGKTIVSKQIAEDTYLFVRIQKSGAITGQSLQVTYIDSTTKQIEVFIIKSVKPTENIETISNKVKINDYNNVQYYQIIQGKVTIFYYGNSKNDISIRLNDLKLFDKNKKENSQLYYDEILICLLSDMK